MAPAFIPRLCCFFLLSALVWVPPASTFYVLKISTDGPVTSGAQSCVNGTLFKTNRSVSVATDPKPYHFHWRYSPLLLTHQSENESSSSITVLGNAPGNYSIAVWVTERHCQSCEPVARSTTHLQFTDSIVGNLSASQAEGNSSIRDGFIEATESDVCLSFKIHDPSDFFKSAEFRYIWALGDGTELVTAVPYARHYYSSPGKYKVSLNVSAQVPRRDGQAEKKTGSFAVELTLLDALRNITVVGSTDATVRLKYNVSLHFFGSPPLMVCWLVKSDCISLGEHQCHQVAINETTYSIGHVFNSAGRYCLSVRAENQVSTLQNYHSITVHSTGIYPLWFVLPCCALIATMLGFIFSLLLKSGSNSSHHKMPIEVADFDFSPSDDKHIPLSECKEPAPGFCAYCTGRDKEAEPLLEGCATPARHYML
ncbi:hypothetical protein XENTR_v10024059 [Xenopus tropicalis]|uniref:Transmembrane protein 130 n=1 Tax=Xenopus tropicalis TaxID=8364 RepID=F6Y5P4_XENTR|nr:transmembrane protein 130 [Xenopus tropicalis]KAE8579475.1 hypothetical protein XENTR_v10024059 [Xenopus tropicalis]